MTTKPVSIRFPKKIADLMQALSSGENKTPSDFIRDAVEEKIRAADSYRGQVAGLVTNAGETISQIRAKLEKERVSRAEISALMHFWHSAYLRGSGCPDPSYVFAWLDVTKDLLTEGQSKKLDLEFDFIHSSLGFGSDDIDYEFSSGDIDYKAPFQHLKANFTKNPSFSWAENLARPLFLLADNLNKFSDAAISEIFSEHCLALLMPLAVKGAKAGLDDHLVSMDMRQLLPDAETFQVGDLGIMVTSEPFYLVLTGSHHCYAFQSESLVSLFSISANRYVATELRSFGSMIKRGDLEIVSSNGKVIIHENNGYRLHLTEVEYSALISNLKRILDDRRWGWLLNRFRNLKGDA